MADQDAVVVDIRTRGAAQASREIHGVADSMTSVRRSSTLLGSSLGATGRGLSNLRQSMQLGATAGYALRRSAYVAGASVAGLGIIGVKTGIQFNSSMEQNTVAFTQFLGSAKAAHTELGFLYKLAAKTPFETSNITAAAQGLLAVGFNAKTTNSWLKTMGDTISAIPGGGPEQIDSIVRAIGQIHSKGVLQGDELMQLSELGVLNRSDLAKRLGVTPQALMSGNANISASRALPALQAQWDAKYGGLAAKQSQTFGGQMSTLHDNLSMTLGKATWPLFTALRDRVLPDVNKAGTAIGKIFDRKDIKLGEKLRLSRDELDRDLGPIARSIEAQVGAAHIPEKLGDEFGHAAPIIAAKLGQAAWPATKAFATAWWHSGLAGQLFSVAFFAKRMGVFGALGSMAAARFAAAYRRRGGGITAAEDLAAGAGGGKAARVLRGVGKYALPIGVGLGIADAISQTGHNPFDHTTGNYGNGGRRVGNHIFYDDGRAPVAISNAHRMTSPTIHVHVDLDGRQVGNAVVRDAARNYARRGGG